MFKLKRLNYYSLIAFAVMLAGCTQELRIDRSKTASGQDSRVQYIVVHYTAANTQRSIDLLTTGEVSSHYLIDDAVEPKVYQLVDESRRAWHAGNSAWQGRTWLNASTIGIELVNCGYVDGPEGRVWCPYSEAQINQLVLLLKDIVKRHGLKTGAVIGHNDIALGRKQDPGPLFPWRRLADEGLIPWPSPEQVTQALIGFSGSLPIPAWFQQALVEEGYAIDVTGHWDTPTQLALQAFQMKYRPARYDGQADLETAALLKALHPAM